MTNLVPGIQYRRKATKTGTRRRGEVETGESLQLTPVSDSPEEVGTALANPKSAVFFSYFGQLWSNKT